MFAVRRVLAIQSRGQRMISHMTRLAGRLYLPGSDGKNFPQYLQLPRPDFPLAIPCDFLSKQDVAKFAKAFSKSLETLISKFGSVVLRELPIENAKEFSTFVKNSGDQQMFYVGGNGVRENLTEFIYTSTREHPEMCLEPHNEMSDITEWPCALMLCLEKPASEGGENGLTKNKDVLRDLNLDVVEKFRRLGIRYHHYLPAKTANERASWQETMMTENKTKAEEILKTSADYFQWNSDDSLSFWKNLPAFSKHYRTGEEVWFNQAHTSNGSYFKSNPDYLDRIIPVEELPFNTFYGDGTEIEDEVLLHIREVTWKNTVGIKMNKGDVLVIDNMQVQHSRLGFKGDRRMLLSLGKSFE